ncbi:transmembrane protein 104 homolog [Diorhabda carinulata]|uniref:transmembrane protein 104 homolog n=1 Tax=Diorhabda sublineata TaxID=1163346 RepID=UPI0024E1939F|nr:transmembrane protein 104 homolog [Diorhabda sublineata]XP_057652379.1 transmembrane protein 104 homolog [Diorhabda carinulata]
MPQTDRYPSWVGLMYIFNLIVGTGALTLPAAFVGAGWLFSTFMIIFLAFISFVTVTFVIESMACANATLQWRRIHSNEFYENRQLPGDSDSELEYSNEETAILNKVPRRLSLYKIDTKVELGEIAGLYLNKFGHTLFFSSLCIYLYGDLAIYTAASGKTLINLICNNGNETDDYSTECLSNYNFSKVNMYRLFVTGFALLVGPFAYFNVQKTKYLQLFTICIRWLAFFIMVTLASIRLLKLGPQGHPDLINLKEIPALAGSTVYSFMCHHSLPSLVAPISNKDKIISKISYDFIAICCFYLLLSITGSFAFATLNDLYSLNFIYTQNSNYFSKVIGFFLVSFPLFPMSTSFPIIAITLQGNLKNLMLNTAAYRNNVVLNRFIFPTLAIAPPVIVALCTHNIKYLVEITGTYAGVIVQYVVPTILVGYARKQCMKDFGFSVHKFSSPFKNRFWYFFVISWSIICLIFVTVDFIINK